MRLAFTSCLLLLCIGTVANAKPFDKFRDCDVCPEMIELPLGEYMMGAPEGESRQNYHWYNNGWRPITSENPYIAYHEGPVHRVEIDIPIAMSRNEVTYGQWIECVNDGGCNGYVPDATVVMLLTDRTITDMQAIGDHPVMRVSYLDAVAYTNWLNVQTGAKVYRLPTEAEWEYAARAGTQSPFAQGEQATNKQVNVSDPMFNEDSPDFIISGRPVSVDELDAANAWGLRHMSGNASEVTMSCWSDRYELWPTSSIYLRQAELSLPCERVVRGGSYDLRLDISRVGARAPVKEDTRITTLGFRVVREFTD